MTDYNDTAPPGVTYWKNPTESCPHGTSPIVACIRGCAQTMIQQMTVEIAELKYQLKAAGINVDYMCKGITALKTEAAENEKLIGMSGERELELREENAKLLDVLKKARGAISLDCAVTRDLVERTITEAEGKE